MESVWEAAFEQPEITEEPEPVEEQDFSLDLIGLLNVGRLSEEIDVYGHKVVIQTLKMGEELEIGLLTKKYADTLEIDKALVVATVAACISTVDGNPLVSVLGPSESLTQSKFDYIRNNWYWQTVRVVYLKFVELRERVDQVSEELIKK